jgi:hypothetical protein
MLQKLDKSDLQARLRPGIGCPLPLSKTTRHVGKHWAWSTIVDSFLIPLLSTPRYLSPSQICVSRSLSSLEPRLRFCDIPTLNTQVTQIVVYTAICAKHVCYMKFARRRCIFGMLFWDLDTVIPVSADSTCSQICVLYCTIGEIDYIRLLIAYYLIELHPQNDLNYWHVLNCSVVQVNWYMLDIPRLLNIRHWPRRLPHTQPSFLNVF